MTEQERMQIARKRGRRPVEFISYFLLLLSLISWRPKWIRHYKSEKMSSHIGEQFIFSFTLKTDGQNWTPFQKLWKKNKTKYLQTLPVIPAWPSESGGCLYRTAVFKINENLGVNQDG